MTIHKEGYTILLTTLAILVIVNVAVYYLGKDILWLRRTILGLSLLFFAIVLQFFRHPSRNIVKNPQHVICPADGKIVVIEEVEEKEYFKGKRLQVSVFMSPINVHVNRYPIGGTVAYAKYHVGEYLVAWHPKASELNERTTVVVNDGKRELLYRQIAGALARRIVMYAKEGEKVEQGQESGFIKFGSRVDVFLPVGTKVNVAIGDVVRGGETILAKFEE